jgi:hypothetical protein
MYSGGKALKIADTTGTSTKGVTFTKSGDVVVYARGGSSGGWPSLQMYVDGLPAGAPNAAPDKWVVNDYPAHYVTINLRASFE